jgi:hypothetical protein
VLLKQAGFMKDYRAVVPVGHHQEADPLAFMSAMVPSTTTVIENELHTEGGIKFALILDAELEKPAQSGDNIMTNPFFHSGSEPILNTGEIQKKLNDAITKIMKKIEEFTNEGSGCRLRRCVALNLQIA